MNVSDLGFSADEIRAIVVERAADKLCAEVLGADMSDYADAAISTVERKVKAQVDEAIRPAIDAAITKTLEPFVEGQLEQIVFQKTNEWGEKRGEAQTFRERPGAGLAALDAQVKPLGNGRWVPIWDSTGGPESNPINGRTK